MSEWEGSKIFGVGPLVHKMGAFRNAPDSEYIYMLASKGIVGFIAYLGLLLTPVVILWKYRREHPHAMLGILIPIAFLIIAVSNFTVLNVRTGMFYYFLLALSFSGLMKNQSYKMGKTLRGLNLIKDS